MTVLVLECAPPAVRGELTRWFLEVKAGVFVGTANRRIRELLWERLCATPQVRGAVMLCSANNEQGYVLQMHGTPHRKVIVLEGVQFICRDAVDPVCSQTEGTYDVDEATAFWNGLDGC